ncbi:MAG: hypothetical protein OXC00_00770 [Acidimicrobiaceae bacterium]|nr:hypothetical protein [Acidimicrobiaceae bacterium]
MTDEHGGAGCGDRWQDQLGLATLEWLLIVAAVASLAALAVTLVASNVSDTAERISESEARLVGILHAAQIVEDDARDAAAGDFDTWADWERHFSRECDFIAVLYAGTEIEMANNFMGAARGTIFDAAAAGYAAAADEQPATATKAQVQCDVG